MERRPTHVMRSDTEPSMEVAARIDMLRQMYEVYDAFSRGLTVACKRGCATCCTQNVTMTTLEGYGIFRHLISVAKTSLLEAVRGIAHKKRFQPTLSTNELAALSMQGEDPPEEDEEYTQMACPFLSRNECLVYQERPFGCRCFFSTQACETEASAIVDPFLITVNTAFLQLIEHIDTGGLFGNMIDVLLLFEQGTERKRYALEGIADHVEGLARNRPIPALLIPPEHEQRLQPILQQLKSIMNRWTKDQRRIHRGLSGGTEKMVRS